MFMFMFDMTPRERGSITSTLLPARSHLDPSTIEREHTKRRAVPVAHARTDRSAIGSRARGTLSWSTLGHAPPHVQPCSSARNFGRSDWPWQLLERYSLARRQLRTARDIRGRERRARAGATGQLGFQLGDGNQRPRRSRCLWLRLRLGRPRANLNIDGCQHHFAVRCMGGTLDVE